MDFHWTGLHTWLTSGAGLIISSFFYKRIGDVFSGASSAAGEFIFKHIPILNRRKTRMKGSDAQMIRIADLSQQVKDLSKTVRLMSKKQDKTDKRLEDCQGERTECRADLKNILFRVEVLEGKRKLARI